MEQNGDVPTTKKPLIGVDIDDTFIDFMTAFLAYRTKKYGEPFEPHHFNTFHLDEIWGCSPEEAMLRIEEFYDTEEHKVIPPVPGAVDALRLLAKTFEIHGITARPQQSKAMTTALVELHAEDIFTELHFLGHQKKKGDFCVELGTLLMIDDALHNAHSVGEKGIPVLLLDRPWNQGPLPPHTIRVHDWDEVPSLINRLVQKGRS